MHQTARPAPGHGFRFNNGWREGRLQSANYFSLKNGALHSPIHDSDLYQPIFNFSQDSRSTW